MEAAKFNLRSPAVKRILQEIKEIRREASEDFLAEALEENIFEWHFVIRGSPDTEFRGGVYHGRIILPAEYPFKPPSFTMLTQNGRFETNTKICLSISSHHPEHWQPSWSVRTALVALTAFMPSPGHGAIGSLDYTKAERQGLAAKSRQTPPAFGGPERREVSARLHQQMLDLHPEDGKPQTLAQATSSTHDAAATAAAAAAAAAAAQPEISPVEQTAAHSRHAVTPLQRDKTPAIDHAQVATGSAEPSTSAASARPLSHAIPPKAAPRETPAAQANWEDKGLTFLALVLALLITAIIFRKLLLFSGLDIHALLTQQ